jgi:SAM-dependent methyltransferase
MDAVRKKSLAPEFRKFMPLFAALDGPILDAPCGCGRHSISLQESGCQVVCADIDDRALEQLACSNRTFTEAGQHHLEIYKKDLINADWPFEEACFSGALNVHLYEQKLIRNIAFSLASGGLLYMETIANRKGNFHQLPDEGEIRSILADTFDFRYLKESHAGPADSRKVTVRMLAQKI